MALAELPRNTGVGGSSPPGGGFLASSDLTSFLSESPPHDDGLASRAREVRQSMPPPPVNQEYRNQAPGILDRRKSTRPNSIRVDSLGGTRSVRSPKGRIPIKVDGVAATPLASPPVTSPMSMANVRGEMRAVEEDATPGETSASETFEDASETASVSEGYQNSESINDTAYKMNAGQLQAMHSRQNTAETFTPALQQREGSSSPELAVSRVAHSRQQTTEAAPSLAVELAGQDFSRSVSPAPSSGVEQSEHEGESGVTLSDLRSRLQLHSRTTTADTISYQSPVELGPERNLKRLSRQKRSSVMMDAAPADLQSGSPPSNVNRRSIHLSSDSKAIDRAQSASPVRIPIRPQSPPKPVRGLSTDAAAFSPRPGFAAERVQSYEQRVIGERPATASAASPQPGGLARTASTRIAGFLGRMGSMRKPGKSPPAPSQARFAAERRNTSHSILSTGANGTDGLASIEDGAENISDAKRPSLQDQFQSLRRQEEHSTFGLNGYSLNGDEERTPVARTASDAGIHSPKSSISESPESKTSRSVSTPGPMKSPPLDPTLPPGTASGLTAGPADEPRPVDWDLWQAVVYEGPAAVARSSGEELNLAIASGIPAAIRGVVWQVLAESKSTELENVYRTLKARGSGDSEQQQLLRPGLTSREESYNTLDEVPEETEKESEISSSKASVHSAHSTPATSAMASQTSPSPSVQADDPEVKAEKEKREAAALSKLEKAIKRDLGSRTSFSKYAQAAGLQDGLFGLCKAYALYDEGVGYAQGINFIAMPLLFNLAEEEAFTLLVRLMSKYDLRSMFTGDMLGLHLRLYQFERLLEDHDPALYCHLRRRNVGPQLYATQWFLTLFAYRFPLQLVLRIYDLIFSQGLTVLLKFGFVLMQRNRDALLEMKDMGHLTNFLKEKLFDVYIDKSPSASSLHESGFFGYVTGGADKEVYRADEMVRDACEVEISDATLAAYTTEWESTQRHAHEKDVELESLRVANNALTTRVKSLEERTQQQDTEHVSIAGDVVRIKVENDTLQDENEGLKIKMEELQKMLDAQPAEVEEKLKAEMDRILQRNSEVQSENRVLKEEQEEMEQELVNVKMMHAQAQADFEALMKKWTNVQAMLSEK